ncbi:MAG: HlyD family secretion protein [Colwellia sp.]
MKTQQTWFVQLKIFFKTHPKLVFFPVLLLGILVLILSIVLKPKLAITAGNGSVRVVDIMPLNLVNVSPEATGFGQIKPKHQWSAIAEVTGEIIYQSPLLSKGNFISAGTQLLRIDPLKYELALAQAQADLNSRQLQLAKLDQEQINLAKNLEIEKSRLLLTQQENIRLSKLHKKGLYSQSNLDEQYLKLLTSTKTVQEISQQLSLFANEKSVAVAQINLSKASVAEAKRSLEKTTILAPRDIKLAQVNVEINQVISINETMIIGHALEVMEVEAQVSINDMHTLISSLNRCADCTVVKAEVLKNIEASIILSSGNMTQTWAAKVTRISETIDLNQATVGVILEVTQDLTQLEMGRPPLLNGMFIKAKLKGQKTSHFAVPEKAIHTNRIYIKDEENKLKIVPITVLYRTELHTVISGEITVGEKVVLNDLLPAVAGMSLADKISTETVSVGADK